ncbi:MAG: Mrp/NBP35 family ATP-binding protein [Deltaproteobacteria bacterium]|nr:Mrp/NBP35 family ATP-binding protein [Deltaproteobacteria bacterium]
MTKQNSGNCSTQGSPANRAPSLATIDELPEEGQLQERMALIRHKIIVMSGKGGVGKSTVAVNLAVALTMGGKRVGLLDADIHGPSVPKLLGLERAKIRTSVDAMLPLEYSIDGRTISVMSIGFLLPDTDAPIIWRGPLKMGAIKQFLEDVSWGELDYLIIDSPPGTGDEPLSVCQLINGLDGAIIVTTPQELALVDVRKSVNFCRQLRLPVLGVIENMSGLDCPHCGGRINVFSSGGGEKMANDMGVPFLGRIPIDPEIVKSGDEERPYMYFYPQTGTAQKFDEIVERIAGNESPVVSRPQDNNEG